MLNEAVQDAVIPSWQRVTEYTISAVPEDLCVDAYAWNLTVSWRGPDRWAIVHHGSCLDANGHWDYERSPSNREDDWKEKYRFPLEEALRLAHEAAPKLKINGYLPADLIAKYAEPA